MNAKFSPMLQSLLTAAAFVVVIAGMKMAESLLVPFLLSIFIALILLPFLAWLKNRGVPNGLAIGLIVFAMTVIGWLLGILVGASTRDFLQNIPEYQLRLEEMSHGLLSWLSNRGVALDIARWQEIFDPGVLMKMAGATLSSFGSAMTNIFLILLTVIFILAEEVSFSEKLRRARGGSESTNEALKRFSDSVNSYLSIKTLLSLLTATLILVWLLVLGVDYPVLWAVLAFALNFVPTVGSIIAAIPVVLLALVQLGPLYAGLTTLGYLVVNIVVGNVLEPRWMGRGLNLSPLVVFLSLVLWGWVLGPVGMLLSIPLTMMAKIALENQPDTRWIGIMLGSGKATDDAP